MALKSTNRNTLSNFMVLGSTCICLTMCLYTKQIFENFKPIFVRPSSNCSKEIVVANGITKYYLYSTVYISLRVTFSRFAWTIF